MANSTLLQLMRGTMQEMGVAGINAPSSVIGSGNPDVVQTLARVNAAGRALAREFDWQYLQTQYNFTATTYSYTGDPALDSTSITNMSSIANLDSTFMVTGIGIAQDTFVVSASSTTVVLNRAATATGTGVTLTFSKVLFAPPTDFDRLIDRTQWDSRSIGKCSAPPRHNSRNGCAPVISAPGRASASG